MVRLLRVVKERVRVVVLVQEGAGRRGRRRQGAHLAAVVWQRGRQLVWVMPVVPGRNLRVTARGRRRSGTVDGHILVLLLVRVTLERVLVREVAAVAVA